VWPNTFTSAPVAWTVTALAVLAFAYRWRPALVALAVATVPVLIIWLTSLGGTTYFFGKYLMFVVPMWAVLAGAGLATLRLPRRATAGASPATAETSPATAETSPATGETSPAAPTPRTWIGSTLGIAGVTVTQVLALGAVAAAAIPGQLVIRGTVRHSWITYPKPQDDSTIGFDYRGAAQAVARGYQPGDAIAYPRAFWWSLIDVGVGYYLPASVHPRDVFLEHTAAEANATHATECPDAEACLGTEQRIWVVAPTKWSKGAPLMMFTGDQVKAMDRHFRPTTRTYVNGLTVVLFQRTA
jgi:mannosyltransferase